MQHLSVAGTNCSGALRSLVRTCSPIVHFKSWRSCMTDSHLPHKPLLLVSEIVEVFFFLLVYEANSTFKLSLFVTNLLTTLFRVYWFINHIAARLAQLDKHRSAEREVASSNPSLINTHDLKTAEVNVLPLSWHLQMVKNSRLLG